MYATTTVNAPNGVTKIASVNAYAAKFAISPMIINTIISNGFENESTHPGPPCDILEVFESCLVRMRAVEV